ncbi:hypothetical protein PINS_up020816 [Pythium insidiosum]|nr:hypothetical protein PINS_up020816 [Pythium insidiosum]
MSTVSVLLPSRTSGSLGRLHATPMVPRSLQPLFISHFEQPRCFKDKRPSITACSTFGTAKRGSLRLDFAMASQKRKVLLILNEAPSHAVAHLELSNVVIFFLPEAMTALNPMMIGVLSTLKMRFRRLHLRHVIDKSDEASPRLWHERAAGDEVALASWNELSAETIERSWALTQMWRTRTVAPDLHLNLRSRASRPSSHISCFSCATGPNAPRGLPKRRRSFRE